MSMLPSAKKGVSMVPIIEWSFVQQLDKEPLIWGAITGGVFVLLMAVLLFVLSIFLVFLVRNT